MALKPGMSCPAVYTVLTLLAFNVYGEGDQPCIVDAREGRIPSDAFVLFDGTGLSEWTSHEGGPSEWIVRYGAMIVNKSGIVTKREFGDMQLHIEFATPEEVKGTGQDRGNSGVYLQGIYEIQVLDYYKNETYIDGMCGSVYGQYPPLVNASRPPGHWQTYDIIFRAPQFDTYGNVSQPATVTLLHNGVLIQDHVSIKPTPGGVRDRENMR